MIVNFKRKISDIVYSTNMNSPIFIYNGEFVKAEHCYIENEKGNILDLKYFRNYTDLINDHPFKTISTTSTLIYDADESIDCFEGESNLKATYESLMRATCENLKSFIQLTEKEFLDKYKLNHPGCDVHDDLDDIYVYDITYYRNEDTEYSISIEHGYGFPGSEEVFIRKKDVPNPIASIFADNTVWLDNDYTVKDNHYHKD